MSRISTPGLRQAGLIAWGFSQISGRVMGTEPPKLFLNIGRNHGLFRGWLHFAGNLMPGGKLPRRESEMVILRVASLRDCAYEQAHHERLGKRAGLSKEEMAAIADESLPQRWSSREQQLLNAAATLVTHKDLSDAEWDALREHLDEAEVVEFLMLVGHYDMLATFINTLRLDPDVKRK